MLDELAVENLGLIAEAHLEPPAGFVVITGETGAGKTLLLGALRLLRGDAAPKGQIGPAGDEARVEARLVSSGRDVVLARRVSSSRSRAYLDGSMVPARVLGEHTTGVLEIVGQHDRLLLTESGAVRDILDGVLEQGGNRGRDTYLGAWANLAAVRAELALLGSDRHGLERELDMARFQVEEIDAAGFSPGEDVELAARATRLRNAETLAEKLTGAERALDGTGGAGDGVEAAVRELRQAARSDPSLEATVTQAEEAAMLVAELTSEIGRIGSTLQRDREALDVVEARLALLGDLKRKYGDTLAEVLAFGEKTAQRVAELEDLLGRSGKLEDEMALAADALASSAADLRAERVRAADTVTQAAIEHLRDLGFGDPVVEFEVTPIEPGPTGADRITVKFASDASLQPAPVARIASGGELSRLVLAIRLAAGRAEATVVAFDEIDAGLGGETALAMGRKLASLGQDRQVLCVSHLPQVAAFADAHFVVERTGTQASVRRVEGDDRVDELTRMLAGLAGSQKGRDHAAELLALARAE
jgi:DNA repair protein RecN (Recombination protein N)